MKIHAVTPRSLLQQALCWLTMLTSLAALANDDIQVITFTSDTILINGAVTWSQDKIEVRPKTREDFRDELRPVAESLGEEQRDTQMREQREVRQDELGDGFDESEFQVWFEDYFEDWLEEFVDQFLEDAGFDDYLEPEKGTVYIMPGASLTISPGARVDFAEGFGLQVLAGGALRAVGTEEEKILMQGSGWTGIQFDEGAGASELGYCEIKESKGLGEREGAIRLINFSNLVIDNCTFTNNKAFTGGAIYLENASPRITNSTFTGNSDSFLGGSIYMEDSRAELIDNVFTGAQDVRSGGAIYMKDSSPSILRNRFTGNSANDGGALYLDNSSPSIRFSVINNNTGSRNGGGLFLSGASLPTFENATIAFNLAARGGGMYMSGTSRISTLNTIIYGNDHTSSGSGDQFYLVSPGTGGTFEYSLVQNGGDGFDGLGTSGAFANFIDTLDEDPLFLTPPGEPGADGGGDDMSLAQASPAINAGKPQSTGAGDVDIVGQSVPYNNFAVDMGAFEFPNNPPYVGSSQGDATPDLDEDLGSADEAETVLVDLCTGSGDVDGHDWIVVIDGLPTNGSKLYTESNGDKGVELAIGDELDGTLAIFEPANRRANYEEGFACHIRDIVTDDEGEELRANSMTSPNRKTYTISVTARNDQPSVTSTPTTTVNVFQEFRYEIEYGDPDLEDAPNPADGQDPLSVDVVSLPDWLSLQQDEDGNYVLVGTAPESAEDETIEVVLTVTDVRGDAAQQSFELTVLPPKQLKVSIDEAPSGEPNRRITFNATGDEGDTVSYQWRFLTEDGSEAGTAKGPRVQFLPTVEGVHTAEVTISDDEGSTPATDTAEFAVASGFDKVDDADREAPSAEQEQQIDGVAEDNERARRAQPRNTGSQAFVDLLEELARLQLNSQQRGVLLDALYLLLAAEVPVPERQNELLGILHNLIQEQPLSQALTSGQLDTALEGLTLHSSAYTKMHLLKAMEVLNSLIVQQQQPALSGQLALEMDAVAKRLASSAQTAGSLQATALPFIRLRAETINLAIAEDPEQGPVLLAGREDSANVIVPVALMQAAATLWETETLTVVVMDSAVAADELAGVVTVQLFDATGALRSLSELSTSLQLALPLLDETKMTPKRYDPDLQLWLSQGVSVIPTENAERVTFSVNSDGDYALVGADAGSDTDADAVESVTNSVEELGSCLFNSL